MTAVDHAELKRVADWCRTLVNPDGAVVTRAMMVETLDQAANGILALLSEIEGLKAEREGEDVLIDVARILEDHVNYDDENSEHIVGLNRRRAALSAAEAIAPYLRTQAPDRWRPDRGAERLTTAAIRHSSGVIVTVERPDRHGECINFLNRCGLEYREGHGFLTSTGRFVDRQEAARIAEGNGQGKARPNCNGNLFSEDLWDEPLRPQTAESGE